MTHQQPTASAVEARLKVPILALVIRRLSVISSDAPSPGTLRTGREEKGHLAHWPLVSLASILILLAVAYLWLQLITPSDGTHLRPGTNAIASEGLVLSAVVTRADGLRDGDVVTAVDGWSMEVWARALFVGGIERPRYQVGDTVSYTVIRDGQLVEVAVLLERYPLGAVVGRTWGTILFALVYLVVAVFVFARRPNYAATRILFLSASALLASTTWSLGAQVSDFLNGVGFWLFQLTTVAAFMLFWTTLCHFALLFPRPLAITRQRWLYPVMYGLPYLALAGYLAWHWLGAEGVLAWLSRWGQFTSYHAAIFLSLGLVAVATQYRAHPLGPARQQIRWVIFAALLAGGSGLLLYILPPLFGVQAVHPNFIGLIVSLFPVAIAVAVLRHNLFDIDALLNRSLVYGMLTLAVVGLYVLVVGMLGTVFQTRGDPFVALVATGVAAVLFQPLRERLQRAVNYMMYGERDDPQTVLMQLGKRLEATLAPNDVLPTLVETIAQTLKLPFVALMLGVDEASRTTVSYGRPKHPPARFPLMYGGEPVGELALEPRAADEAFTPAELQLIATIAQQAGVAAYAVQLTEDLQRSRERLVSAREEERRRLRRDLHDGLGPALAGLTLKLDAARNLMSRDPGATELLLVELREHVQTLVHDVRRLVYALRPPTLDQLGLAGALREGVQQLEHEGLRVELRLPHPMPPLSAAVEVAVYRIAQEALTNVLRHARATACLVALRVDRVLELVVADDGIGLPSRVQAGVGLTSMRERSAELGGECRLEPVPAGGTCVKVQFPLREVR